MLMSDISVESLANNFNQKIVSKGFFKGSLRYFSPYQSSGLMQIDREVVGLVLFGELSIELSNTESLVGAGFEFFLPPNVCFHATARHNGAHFIVAIQRMNLQS